jgi:RimJ/RimL family protein N-acetyltransferase
MDIRQRNVNLDDADQLLEWRNTPGSRANSLRSDQISKLEHMRWFSERLKRIDAEPFLMFETNKELIGMTRLDCKSSSENYFEISIIVNPELLGQGIGSRILEITCEHFFHRHPDKIIVAKVNLNNTASQRLFIKAGFSFEFLSNDFMYYRKLIND